MRTNLLKTRIRKGDSDVVFIIRKEFFGRKKIDCFLFWFKKEWCD